MFQNNWPCQGLASIASIRNSDSTTTVPRHYRLPPLEAFAKLATRAGPNLVITAQAGIHAGQNLAPREHRVCTCYGLGFVSTGVTVIGMYGSPPSRIGAKISAVLSSFSPTFGGEGGPPSAQHEETGPDEGKPLAPSLRCQGLSKRLPLTDRVALGSQEVACETRSPLPQKRGRGKECCGAYLGAYAPTRDDEISRSPRRCRRGLLRQKEFLASLDGLEFFLAGMIPTNETNDLCTAPVFTPWTAPTPALPAKGQGVRLPVFEDFARL